jgi:hypothetical protein
MGFTLHLTLCGILILTIVAVALYRKWLEDHGDHYLHLHNDALDTRTISSQETVAKRIDTLDKITRYLTIAVIVYGVAIAGIAAYNGWISSNSQ